MAVCRSDFAMLYNVGEDADTPTNGLDGGAIAAIVIGSIFGAAILGIVGWVVFKLVRDKQKYKKFVSGTIADVTEDNQ